jgi:hypothetical protein
LHAQKKIEIFTSFASFWPLAFLGLNNHQASAATFKNLITMDSLDLESGAQEKYEEVIGDC